MTFDDLGPGSHFQGLSHFRSMLLGHYLTQSIYQYPRTINKPGSKTGAKNAEARRRRGAERAKKEVGG
jgi:hypothetical protein